MNIYEAAKAALEERTKTEGPKRVWISRRAWSIGGKELESGSCLLVTPSPEGCIFMGEFGSRIPNYPLNGADLLAEDWYLTRPPFQRSISK